MENNWYDNNTYQNNSSQNNTPPQANYGDINPYGSYNAGSGGDGGGKKPKKRRTITITQFVVCMLVVALVVGGLSTLVTQRVTDNNNQQALGDTFNNEPNGNDGITGTDGKPDASPDNSNGNSQNNQNPPSNGLSVSNTATEYDSITEMIQACMASVVGIDVEFTSGANSFFGESTTSGSGSGVILTADGYIVTNNHVVSGAVKITVHLQDGITYEASVIGTDEKTDLAVIKIEAENLPHATLGNSSDSLVGEPVYVIGNPLGSLMSTVTNGIISGLDRTIEVEGQTMTLMQTNAAVNPGNSGGGMFNERGELIGIINAKSSGTDVEGIGFAIPIDSAKLVIMDLIDLGYVTGRPYIGISMQNISVQTGGSSSNGSNSYFGNPFGSSGYQYVNRIQVVSIEEGSAAEKGGMLVNDIIIAFDGVEVTGASQLSTLLYEYSAGDVVTITVQRGTETMDLKITLDERTSA